MERKIDLIGRKFGKWTVIREGRSKSCGCLQKERVTTHGMTGTPTYHS
jgi:hypothetical protein